MDHIRRLFIEFRGGGAARWKMSVDVPQPACKDRDLLLQGIQQDCDFCHEIAQCSYE